MSRTDGFIQRVINNMQVRLVLKDDPIIAKESRICERTRVKARIKLMPSPSFRCSAERPFVDARASHFSLR